MNHNPHPSNSGTVHFTKGVRCLRIMRRPQSGARGHIRDSGRAPRGGRPRTRDSARRFAKVVYA